MAKKPKTTSNEKSKSGVDADWFLKRLDELGIGGTYQNAAKALGAKHYVVGRTLAGERKMTPAEICQWAKLLRVPVAVILKRLGENPPTLTVPVIGLVRAHGHVSLLPPENQRQAEMPGLAAGALVALDVETENTELALWSGSTLYYEPATKIVLGAIGRLSAIQLGERESPIVGVLDRGSLGRGRVVVFGGSETIESAHIYSAAPILWLKAY